ncbi:uncharacterized protein LOC120144719 [Hibiscus syriacus]|uniref:uncharacterized protein LOC120144719 n=1 Tax=Hibiscus syriacus TaxID=106335 RepID=UPI0019220B42|nr:uncharacterized protein LOC120144719 [Hibiscus syriacus]
MVEYEAYVMSLRAALGREIKVLKVYGDSSLVVYQLLGEWKTNDLKLVEYRNLMLELFKEFEEVTFTYFPREKNQMTKSLATLAAMFQASKRADVMPILMEVYKILEHYYILEEEVDGRPWYHDIFQYIKYETYPQRASEIEKRTIRRMVVGYILDGGILYKRDRDQVLLRFIDAREAKTIIEEVHSGICETHENGLSMARKIM